MVYFTLWQQLTSWPKNDPDDYSSIKPEKYAKHYQEAGSLPCESVEENVGNKELSGDHLESYLRDTTMLTKPKIIQGQNLLYQLNLQNISKFEYSKQINLNDVFPGKSTPAQINHNDHPEMVGRHGGFAKVGEGFVPLNQSGQSQEPQSSDESEHVSSCLAEEPAPEAPELPEPMLGGKIVTDTTDSN